MKHTRENYEGLTRNYLKKAAAGESRRSRGNNRSRGSGRGGQSSNPSSLSKNELWQLTEELLSLDTGINQPTIREQGKTSAKSTQDSANNPLFESVPRSALNKDTVRLMKQLLDNYYPDVGRSEVRSASEQTEENRFLDALMQTPLMQRLEGFLQEKNLISHGLRQTLEDIWFTLYSRKGGKLGSSGYEHVFIGELKGGKVSGFHNWLNFRKEELEGDLNYMGYMRVVDLNGKGKVIKLRFNWLNKPKPVGSIFVGTTPELEIALYTLCFLAKPNANCPVKLAGKKFSIQTWTSNISGKTVIGSAYPNI
ncbi:endoribonuclease Arlr-like isoform X3 [Panulirus ornatus]|uniref:endoribonuclease Arlr-like isoform X3 n=1 Tax=Panulirus ornatus TaxID=150431 RepID=UPI003A891A67